VSFMVVFNCIMCLKTRFVDENTVNVHTLVCCRTSLDN